VSETQAIPSFPPLMTRNEAATYVAATHGVRISPRTLEDKPIPYRRVNGRALYRTEDLDTYVAREVAEAPRHIGRPCNASGPGRPGRPRHMQRTSAEAA
jgi:hypothetical protein